MKQDHKSWLFLLLAISIFPISLCIILLGYGYQGSILFLAGVPACLIIGINYEKPISREVKE